MEPAYPPITSTSHQGIEFIKDWEDFVPYVYDDQEKQPANKKTRVTMENRAHVKGIETIGYGFTLRYNRQFEEYISNKELLLSKEEAETHLKSILSNDYCKAAARSVGGYLSAQHQFDTIVSIIYNMGAGGFEKTGIYRAIIESDMAKAAEEIYNIGLGTGHAKRRAAERTLFKDGRYEKRT